MSSRKFSERHAVLSYRQTFAKVWQRFIVQNFDSRPMPRTSFRSTRPPPRTGLRARMPHRAGSWGRPSPTHRHETQPFTF